MVFLFAKGRRRAGRFAHISEADARWLALFVDTEGNITIKRTRDVCGIQIAVAGTCRALLERAQSIVGAGNILERPGTNAPVFYWQVSNKAARDLLLRLYPHLIVKQRQARIGIYLESLTGREGKPPSNGRQVLLERLWEANKACNSFGDPELSWVPKPDLFLLSKSARYFYDADAIREGFADERQGNPGAYDRTTQQAKGANNDRADLGFLDGGGGWNADGTAVGRNKRSVWTVASQPYAGAHFATFPAKLIEPCILAGCPERACGVCGAPWVRVVERLNGKSWHDHADDDGIGQRQVKMGQASWDAHVSPRTLGFESSCSHDDDSASGVVLDPFAGAGTTGLVALRHNRSFVGIELNPAYVEMARERIRDDAPLLNCPAEVAT